MIGTIKQLIPKMLNLDENKIYEIKEYKERRSLDANAYYWVLVNKIADKLRTSKEDIHLRMLKEYGQVASVMLPYGTNIKGYAKYFEKDRTIDVKGQYFDIYKLYKGSSEMNTKEMSILIDGTVQDAKELGIETLPPYELERIKESWGR